MTRPSKRDTSGWGAILRLFAPQGVTHCTDGCEIRLVGRLEFNVPFQHKYGYIIIIIINKMSLV